MKLTYPAVFYEGEGGYAVEVPDLPGCASGGATLAEAIIMGTNAASGWVLTELEDGKPVPPSGEVYHLMAVLACVTSWRSAPSFRVYSYKKAQSPHRIAPATSSVSVLAGSLRPVSGLAGATLEPLFTRLPPLPLERLPVREPVFDPPLPVSKGLKEEQPINAINTFFIFTPLKLSPINFLMC
jgi:predicted RNase H-like HicB family nuclease